MSNHHAGGARGRARNLLLSWARLLVLALVGSLAACTGDGTSEATASVTDAADAVQLFAGIPQQRNVLGDPAAPLTLTELSDLRCSHCRDFATKSLPVLVDRYVRSGRLRIVFENLPILGPDSVEAARMAEAAGLQNHLFEFTEVFFARAAGPVDDALLRRVASSVPGLDVDAALSARDSEAVNQALVDARRTAGQFAISGTPSFLLGKAGETPTQMHNVRPTNPDTFIGPIEQALAAR